MISPGLNDVSAVIATFLAKFRRAMMKAHTKALSVADDVDLPQNWASLIYPAEKQAPRNKGRVPDSNYHAENVGSQQPHSL